MFALTQVSKNTKTGPIPVSVSDRSTCPTTCPFYTKGCYAKYGPQWIQWRRVSNDDLPHNSGDIDYIQLKQLIDANKGRKGYSYTHHVLNDHNRVCLENTNSLGFTVNVSTESVEYADKVMTEYKLPAVAVVHSTKTDRFYKTESGRKVITCPATIHENVTCATCGLCQIADREFIIAFPAHGTAKKTVNEIVSNC